jgi:hypothetical protein
MNFGQASRSGKSKACQVSSMHLDFLTLKRRI